MLYKFKNHYPVIAESAYLAPGAKLLGNVTVGEESSIWFNAVLRADNAPITIGNRVSIQDGSVCHVDDHDPIIVEDDVTVGHMVILHGCTVRKGALIGMGSTVMNGAEIGEYALVAAGSLVSEGKKIPPCTMVMGRPAKIIRELTEQEIEGLKRGAEHYVANSRVYLEEKIVE
ncbi:gamma carbonic anhydrase family protein [Brevibacillus daliensis]|uniref:gamma carbonic anhydrase family protein n=1 Tax=Brevibacillus daliensis TaxID=2892995 RepID=UPI001E4C9848|nr:gamma carbonic anhydrase family protein [Brevibacillus daliensis]